MSVCVCLYVYVYIYVYQEISRPIQREIILDLQLHCVRLKGRENKKCSRGRGQEGGAEFFKGELAARVESGCKQEKVSV